VQTVHPEVHPQSPLAKLNFLDVYGAMVNDENHIAGILLLLKEGGGLDAIDLYGMAETSQL
jgi:hypothetical protein